MLRLGNLRKKLVLVMDLYLVGEVCLECLGPRRASQGVQAARDLRRAPKRKARLRRSRHREVLHRPVKHHLTEHLLVPRQT